MSAEENIKLHLRAMRIAKATYQAGSTKRLIIIHRSLADIARAKLDTYNPIAFEG